MKDQKVPTLKWFPNGYAAVARGVGNMQYIIHWDLFSATLDYFPEHLGKRQIFKNLVEAQAAAESHHKDYLASQEPKEDVM